MIKYNINGVIILLIILFVIICIYSYISTTKVDMNRCNSSNIYIDNSIKGGEFGRGVFANKNYKEGDVIETGPLLVGDKNNMFVGLYKNYVWLQNDKIVLALGNISICNHSHDNNSHVIFNNDTYKLIANKNINKGEEVLVTYCYGLTKEQCNLWFSGKNINQIE